MGLILFLCIFIVFCFVMYFYYKKLFYKEKKTNVIVNVDNGWYSINWKELKKDKEVVKSIKWLDDNFDDKLKLEYMKTYFDKIHFYNRNNLLLLCKDIFLNREIDSDRVLSIKRNITASGTLFGFKVPSKLWLMDEVTLGICLKYSSMCDTVEVNIDLIDSSLFRLPTVDEKKEFRYVINSLPLGLNYVIDISRSTPNIIRLFGNLQNKNNRLYLSVNKDMYNLKRVLTICHLLGGVDIPRDYLLIDYNVYNYLKNPHWFRGSGVSHLGIVK